ncbi:MAG: hypothetical protein CVU50_07905 [Candidatus Cloacimonetes bacterium HGW-Cloacimonetes-3]|jgi:uncharacterized protein YegL|nr:MAG: hypothetical protein CVU50_07905 [Candidatus Cloacimonetes bacterium HGW-Cloacimonetes-3]
MRRLPIYLLLDVSGSMRGEPIQALQDGLQILVSTLRQNPYALETAYLSIITFGPTAQQILPLTELVKFQAPALKAEGVGTSMGHAIKILVDKINKEVVKTTLESKGDWKPIVFLLTDGEPTDEFESAIKALKNTTTGIIVACAAGSDANTIVLKSITDNVLELNKLDKATAQSFFQWVSASISTSSQKIEQKKEVGSLDELPQLPADIKKATELRKGNEQSLNPYNTFDRQRALNKDKFGNIEGSDFDLAKDGAFEGYQIAILHLYTGEGFDFKAPERALHEKGFSIHRWADNPPSSSELKHVLETCCQLWLISDTYPKLSQQHIDIICDFYNSGKGLYLWGDNDPFHADADAISRKLFGIDMSGCEMGNKILTKKDSSKAGGFIEHAVTFGIDFLYEGITIAQFPHHNLFTTILYSSEGHPAIVVYDNNNKRAILDGGFTKLYCNWDTAGTGRYVKNAAAWLVNYEYFGKRR